MKDLAEDDQSDDLDEDEKESSDVPPMPKVQAKYRGFKGESITSE